MLPEIPLLALTATVQINERGMVQPIIVDVSPNKENIMFDFIHVPIEKEAATHLKWIAVKGKETPQTIVFCNTFNDISNILSYLLLVLNEKAFTEDSNGKKTSLLGVYHAKSWESQKRAIEHDFKTDGCKRVVIATCALGMGIKRVQCYTVWPTFEYCRLDAASQSWRKGWQSGTLCNIVYKPTAVKMWKRCEVGCESRGLSKTSPLQSLH